jgi:CDP-paratose 2-epimerase
VADPVTDFEINARGTLNVLEAVRRFAPDAPLLFASTNKVYGKLIGDDGFVQQGERYIPREAAARAGFGEETPLSFYSPYGCSKGVADQYVVDYARIYGLQTAVFRMSCLYGPHQYGNEDQGWVAHFLISAATRAPVSIYGDGYQLRDVLFVSDAVRAYLLALDGIDRVCGRAFNLGGGPENALSLRECLRYVRELTGGPINVSYDGWRPGDQLWYVSKTDAFAQACGWRPQVSVADGMCRLYAWIARAFEQEATRERKLAS